MSQPTIRVPFIIAALIVAIAPPLHAATAQTTPEPITVKADGKRKINLSGRERMLSQYIAKSLCFANLHIDEKAQLDEMKLAQHLFERSLVEIRDGSTVQRMLPENDLAINTALDEVERLWFTYGQAVNARDLPAVTAQNLPLMAKMNDAVTLFQGKYGAASGVPAEIGAALNIAGRQRMLTQKASKEFCLIASGIDAPANRASLKATVELFDTSMKGLLEGSAATGLKPAPSKDIADQFGKVTAAWQPLKAIFLLVAEGAAPSPENIATISRQNITVMEAANVAVEMYERLPD